MPHIGSAQGDGALRSRYLVPRDAPRYRELAAALAVTALLAHLLLAQLTLLLTAAMYVTGSVSRWRPQWLAAPAIAGLLWTLAIGLPQAAAGLAAGPRQVIGYLAGIGGHPGHLLTPQETFSGLSHWLPQQFPLALILAAAETLGLCWLQRRLTGGPEWRTGLIVAARRLVTAAWLRSGGVVTRDGAILGVDMATGRPASISWREAEGGILCASPASGPAEDGFAIALAAIRRRKPVIVIDLTGSRRLADSLAAACPEAGAPFSVFGQDGPGCYEPLRGGDPARAARMITAMIDWSGASDQHRRSCAAYLADVLAVQAAAPADRRAPVLDELLCLLTPDGLRERAAQIPPFHPRRDVLADRAGVSANLLQADPAITAAAAEQLAGLLASPLGRWLRPASPDTRPAPDAATAAAGTPIALRTPAAAAGTVRISLGQTVRERGVTLFSLDRATYRDAARMIAALVTADLAAVADELEGMSVSGDSLAWINGYEALGQHAVPELTGQLIARGQAAGMAVVLSTTSVAAAQTLAAGVSVLAAGWPVDPALASTFAGTPAVGPDGMTGATPGAAPGNGPAQAGSWSAGTGAGLAAAGSGLAGVSASPVGAVSETTADLGDIAFGLNGSDAASVRRRGGSSFALLARGGRGAPARVLAHCRSVPPRVGSRGPSAGAGSGERLSAMRELGG